MKNTAARKTHNWFTIAAGMRLAGEEEQHFSFDPDFVVLDRGGGDDDEREVLFEPDPDLGAPTRRGRSQ